MKVNRPHPPRVVVLGVLGQSRPPGRDALGVTEFPLLDVTFSISRSRARPVGTDGHGTAERPHRPETSARARSATYSTLRESPQHALHALYRIRMHPISGPLPFAAQAVVYDDGSMLSGSSTMCTAKRLCTASSTS